MRKHFGAVLLAAFTGLSGPFGCAALAAEQADIDRVERKQADIDRVERKQAARDLARAIFERADNRAKEAVAASPSANKNVQQHVDTVGQLSEACVELAEAELEAGIDCLDDLLDAANRDPNAELVAELRAEFIEEELEALRKTMQEPAIEEVRRTIQGLAI